MKEWLREVSGRSHALLSVTYHCLDHHRAVATPATETGSAIFPGITAGNSLEDTSTHGIRQLRDDAPAQTPPIQRGFQSSESLTHETKNMETPNDPKLSKIGLAGNLAVGVSQKSRDHSQGRKRT